MANLGREPLQIVEMDVQRCTLTYGVAPCMAALGTTGVRKCFNSQATCQNLPNIALSDFTVRFSQNQTGIPRDTLVFPCLTGPVSTNPTKINLASVDSRTGPLGKRARVTIRLQDFTDSDIFWDKYYSERVDGTGQTDEIGYIPGDRGTFFGKFNRRFPFYIGRPIRVLEGYVGDDVASMRARHYVISEWDGPDHSGAVKIIAKDILDLADNEKAVCPRQSNGSIGSEIGEESGVSFDLTPETVGDEYPASGTASIGSEAVSFTRSGDTITLTERAVGGTEVATHNIGDLFQIAYSVTNESIADVAYDLLTNFANINTSFIDLAAWQSEASRWLAGFDMTALILEPTGVTELLGELAQHGVLWWWNDEAQEIGMRANRPRDFDEVLSTYSDDISVIEGTMKNESLYDQRVTQVVLYHGQIDASGDIDSGSNYNRAAVSTVADDPYNQNRVYSIYSRWLGAGNTSVSTAIVNRLLNRYRNPPTQLTFDLDVKDQPSAQVADLAFVDTRVLQDDVGLNLDEQVQITSVEERIAGHILRVTCQSHRFDSRYGIITEDARPDYTASTDEQRRVGTYIVDGSTLEFPDGTGPYVMF